MLWDLIRVVISCYNRRFPLVIFLIDRLQVINTTNMKIQLNIYLSDIHICNLSARRLSGGIFSYPNKRKIGPLRKPQFFVICIYAMNFSLHYMPRNSICTIFLKIKRKCTERALDIFQRNQVLVYIISLTRRNNVFPHTLLGFQIDPYYINNGS